jgi:hypothetical protein
MALLILFWGPKTRKNTKNVEIVHPRGTLVQILTKKESNLSSDSFFELFWGPGTRKILEISKFEILGVKFRLKKVKTQG